MQLEIIFNDTKNISICYDKVFRCECGFKIITETWDEKRCFGLGTCLKGNKLPRYCPNCGKTVLADEYKYTAKYCEVDK